jgi:pimeloyl-ACP methyl ester carboxylesterase
MLQRKACHNSVLIVIMLGLTGDLTRAGPDVPLVADPAYTQAQQLIEIELHRHLNLYCIGTGIPTVIFESGLADDTHSWNLVQPEIAKRTRACAYDRAGVGFSDPARRAGTSANMVDDLHRLLRRASIKPPYVLVGHSYGGMSVVLYAYHYPKEVAGMVLVDPALENQVRHVRRNFPSYDKSFVQPTLQDLRDCVIAATAGFVPGTKPYEKCLPQPIPMSSDPISAVRFTQALSPAHQRATLSEFESLMTGRSGEQLRAARRSFHDMPLIILAIPLGRQLLVPDETQAQQDAIHAARGGELEALVHRSTRGVFHFVPDGGHYIQSDQPAVVVDSIREVLEQVR